MKRFGRGLLAATVVLVMTAGVSTPVAADDDDDGDLYQPPTRYSFEETFDDRCPGTGVTVSVSVKGRGVDSIRNVPGSGGQAFLVNDRYRFEETWTDTKTGAVLLEVEGRGVFEEVAAELVPNADVPKELVPPEGLTGPVYRFTAEDRGRLVVEDPEGRVLAVDRGVAVFQALFDTLGDFKPGGTFLMDEIVRVEGPHPVLLGEVDLCALATGARPAPGDDDDEDDEDDD